MPLLWALEMGERGEVGADPGQSDGAVTGDLPDDEELASLDGVDRLVEPILDRLLLCA